MRKMIAEGVNGALELSEDTLTIRRKGLTSFLTQGSKGNKEIALSAITSIQFKPANLLTNGYMQVGFSGGRESKGGLFDAVNDENTVMFKRRQQEDFERVRDRLNALRAERRTGAERADSGDIAGQIKQLADLRDAGALSEEEFAAKKAELLARL
ncbi:MAG: DUF4429 domain-containing protein [Dehalococcoidia bacterium]|nr:DUF4429 domain-containing protein [Dehalococcoidia bacterium]